MRKISLVKLVTLILAGFAITTLATQCKKEDSKKFKALVNGSGAFCSSCIKKDTFHTLVQI